MENNYRVHTNIGSDTVLKINLQQDVDFLEILSLKLSQENTYKLDNSNYGVIIGRVLANDAFGVPNAKISVFISLNDEDATNNSLLSVYNYKTVNDKNQKNIRYNLLPDESDDDCYRIVGTMPNKRLVLDDDSVLEVFDKYYKYTTVTNNAGDYMLYGIPTGNTMLHVDIDLSDCGVLSQKPRDFMYKGYNETQFDNANQFKESTNLDNLSQIMTQNQGVYVYPFFGEEGAEDIAITRCDIQIQYKFEPTCVFFGSIFSDSFGNNVGPTCTPSKYSGRNSELVCGSGTIEMIRKTIDGLTEEYQIQGNQLIDGDGVWCYQIPMNLDYVGTDEYGNICATDNPNKGIPTRTRVRFRFSMNDTDSDSVSRHRAKYLVPNNPKIMNNVFEPRIKDCVNYDKHYLFGSSTLDEDYRDLFWNKVYSVKNYIPRFQLSSRQKSYNHAGLKTANKYESKNPIPYNKARYSIPFSFMLLCVIIKIVIGTIFMINEIFSMIAQVFIAISKIWGFGFVKNYAPTCIPFGAGLTDSSDNNTAYYPGCWNNVMKISDCPDEMKNCKKSNDTAELFDIVEQALAQAYDVIHLDFYNDWLNGSLYLPLWHWKKTKKKSYFFGLFRKRAKNQFCDCDKIYNRLRILDSCTLNYNGSNNDNGDGWHKKNKKSRFKWGIIKNIINNSGLNLYYYSAGNIVDNKPNENNVDNGKPFVRLFSTDIILLGTFNDCDLDGVPQPYNYLPSTTANIPGIARTIISDLDDEEEEKLTEGTTEESGDIEVTGMDWLHKPNSTSPKYKNGLFFGIDCTEIYTKPKSCININRISELGVNLDMTYDESYIEDGVIGEDKVLADGLISKIEIDDYESRAMFATLNHNGLDKLKIDEKTGYKTYDFRYIYPVDFDGRNNKNILNAYNIPYSDIKDDDYLTFKYGPDFEFDKNGNRTSNETERIIHNYTSGNLTPTRVLNNQNNEYFPLFNNSYYFYFGLNEGKTAIDKFKNKFTAKCFSNNKLPFSIDITKEPSKWCPYDDDCNLIPSKSGVIEINLPDIKKPYSYKLTYDTSGEQIISESNININKILFGINMIANNQYEKEKIQPSNVEDYYASTDGYFYKKDGLFHYVKNYQNVASNEEGDIKIENTIYKLYITDANNKTQSVSFTIAQSPISLISNSTSLGTKYVPFEDLNNENHSSICDIYDMENYGTIELTKVMIDGDEYEIQSIDSYERLITESDVFDVFNLTVKNDNDSYQVQLSIRIKSLLFETDHNNDGKERSIFEIGCGGELTNNEVNITGDCETKTFEFKNGVFSFKIWVPGKYEFKLTQYCCGELNDNSSISIITIENGQIFEALINKVPLTFLNQPNDPNNVDFWQNVNQESVSCVNNDIVKSSVYNFPSIAENEIIWSDYIDYSVMYDENGIDKYCNAQTKLNALIYKFETIFRLSNSVYFSDNGDNTFKFTTHGGKNVLKQVFYPSYNEFENHPIIVNNNNTINFNDSILQTYVLSDVTDIPCDEAHPNIVAQNYKFFSQKINNKGVYTNIVKNNDSLTTYFNPLFTAQNDKIASNNYFAAFTNNATVKYEKIPNVIGNRPSNLTFDNMVLNDAALMTYYNQYLKYWFNIRFVDRRLGYRIAVFSSSPILKNMLNINDETLINGRVSIQTIGGIDLAYQMNDDNGDEYNIIEKVSGDTEPTLEYFYYQDEISCNKNDVNAILNECYDENNKTSIRKYFYKSNVSFDFAEYDIRKAFFNTSYNGTDFTIIPKWGESDETSFILNHAFDQQHSNGYYGSLTKENEKNRLPKRYTDIANVPLNNLFKLNLSSCSYDIAVNTNYPNEFNMEMYDENTDDYLQEVNVVGSTTEGENIDLTISCSNIYNIGGNNIDSYAETGNFNVLVIEENGECIPKYLRLEVGFGKDYSSSIDYTVYKPLIIPFDDIDELINIITDIKSLKRDNDTYVPIESINERSENRNKFYNSGKSDDEPFDTYEYIHWFLMQNYITWGMKIHEDDSIKGTIKDSNKISTNAYEYKFIVEKDNSSIVLRSNDDIFNKISTYLEGSTSTIGNYCWRYFNNPCYGKDLAYNIQKKYLMLFGGREYFDSTNSLIEKNIKVFDMNKIYEFNPFKIINFASTLKEDNIVNVTFTLEDFNFGNQIRSVAWHHPSYSLLSTLKKVESEYICSINENIINISFRVNEDILDLMNINWILQVFIEHENGLIYGLSFSIDSVNETNYTIRI